MIAWPMVQARLGVKVDGMAGPITYGALLCKVAGHDVDGAIGTALAINADAYEVSDTPQRLAAFVGQTCHESGGYKLLRELWGPTPQQRAYEGRADLGNTQPGDGYKYRGRGCIQITGRDAYHKIGKALGLDLEGNPSLAEQPSVAMLVSLEWWHIHNMNIVADSGNITLVTRKVNGGVNGLTSRQKFTETTMELLA